MATFPPLINETAGGKTMLWSIKVTKTKEGYGRIEVERGQEGGKVIHEEKIVTEGKNIGKKNETSPLEQAILEARSTMSKKLSAGYVEAKARGGAGGPSLSAAASVRAEPTASSSESASAKASAMSTAESIAPSRAAAIDTEVPLPMLAERFQDRGSKIKYPAFVQPKFDGTRTVAICGVKGSSPCLFSRTRKAYPHLEHIQEVVRQLPKGLILDGELYTNEYNFQEIVGTVKKKTLTKEDALKHGHIQLHVYDIIIEDIPFEKRWEMLQAIFERFKDKIGTVLQLCKTEVVSNPEEVVEKHDEYVEEGYEGIMIRNAAGLYKVGGRSNDLQKLKTFMDAEYEIVGFYEGDGAEKGCVMWRCKTADGKVFGCRPKGTHEERAELFKHGSEYIGKMLTVKFQELTEDGIPRFPVGIVIRDYE
uniref:Polydeoxyribonucleotide synthase [ATP] n=1 Tax=viral metagenome TaxID=1070528 RepID=A0A6C0ARI8_9ZZZZ